MLHQALHVVHAVQALLHIVQVVVALAVAGAAAHVRRDDAEAFADQVLDQRRIHGELLAFRAAVDLEYDRAGLCRIVRFIQPVGHAQAVERGEVPELRLHQGVFIDFAEGAVRDPADAVGVHIQHPDARGPLAAGEVEQQPVAVR